MFVRLLAATALAVAASSAHAAPYTAEYVFGDSLSDNGNLAEALGSNFPNPPSYHDSFTNGPTAAVVLASSFGLTLNPSLWLTGFQDVNHLFGPTFTAGTNYAVAGATSAAQAVGGPASINLPQQVGTYGLISGGHADPNALYVVDIGGNDVRNAVLQSTGAAAIAAGVSTEVAAIAALAGEGARNILVVNVPNVGLIPEFSSSATQSSAATTDSQLYDAQLGAGIAAATLPPGTRLTQFDLYGYNQGILANAGGYGFTDTSDPCFLNTNPLGAFNAATSAACGPGAQNINSFLYWDAIHPTLRVQALWAAGFESALANNVPEPSTATLLGVSLLGLLGLSRRRSAV